MGEVLGRRPARHGRRRMVEGSFPIVGERGMDSARGWFWMRRCRMEEVDIGNGLQKRVWEQLVGLLHSWSRGRGGGEVSPGFVGGSAARV